MTASYARMSITQERIRFRGLGLSLIASSKLRSLVSELPLIIEVLFVISEEYYSTLLVDQHYFATSKQVGFVVAVINPEAV